MSTNFDPRSAGGRPGPWPERGGWTPAGRAARSVRWILILAVIALVALPVLIPEIPREIARWHEAAGLEDYLDGNLPAAIRQLDTAISWDPDNAHLHLARAEFKRRAGDLLGSLQDCDQAVQLAPDEMVPLMQRSQVLLDLGRHRRAVEDAKKVERLSREKSPEAHARALNQLAYFRAVGKVELQEALANIEKAIQIFKPRPAFLDTRGYIRYLLGKLQAARKDLDAAVKQVEGQYAVQYGEIEKARHQAFDLREFELQRAQDARNVAVLRYHRALILEQLNETALAQKDLERVKALGFQPNDKLY